MADEKKETLSKLLAEYHALVTDRSEWEAEAREISDYLIPGRGIYTYFTKPQKRKLTSPNVINPKGREALGTLTSGLQGGLTSPSRAWFMLKFRDERANQVPQVKMWLGEAQKILYAKFAESNFYQVMHSFYNEFAGFGTGAMYMGEDASKGFRFEILTFGEYVFAFDASGNLYRFYRILFMSPAQLVQKFGEDKVSESVREAVELNQAAKDLRDRAVLHAVYPNEKKDADLPFTSVYFEIAASGGGGAKAAYKTANGETPLRESGFFEFPFMVGRWSVIGSDDWGIGPGAMALPDIKRLQEMEKSFLMAVHKDIDPPTLAPAHLQGTLNTLPGGQNYKANQNDTVDELYRRRFEYVGVSSAVERVERRIERVFYNEVFLTASRDPDASPLKATQVMVQEAEKMLRLGPVIEQVYYEVLQNVIDRGFHILLRNGKFPELDPEFADLVGDYDIVLTSPLAQAQKQMAIAGIQNFLGFVGGVASYNPEAVDKVDFDQTIDEFGDVSGAPASIIVPTEIAEDKRTKRAEAQARAEAEAKGVVLAQGQLEGAETQSKVAKNYASAGVDVAQVLETGGLPQ
jgi:hypothetical protein